MSSSDSFLDEKDARDKSALRVDAGMGMGINDPALALPFTGERIVPRNVPEALFREHEARYVFAGQFVAGKDVLDVACGSGIGTSYLLRAGARSCLGLDIDKGAIDYARAAYGNCLFAQSEATDLSLPNESVDVVVSFETIEHLVDQRKFLMECRRVLRPSGLLICSTPNRKIFKWYERNPYHVREFSVGQFLCLVESVFCSVQVNIQGERFYPSFVARRLLSRVLDGLRLKGLIKRVLDRAEAAIVSSVEFGEDGRDIEIRQLRHGWFIQPTYLLALCRKGI